MQMDQVLVEVDITPKGIYKMKIINKLAECEQWILYITVANMRSEFTYKK